MGFRVAIVMAGCLLAVLAAVRGPLGKLVSRSLVSAAPVESLPGAPKGPYVVLQFRSDFERKKAVTETVTPRLEDGAWRVSGYFLR